MYTVQLKNCGNILNGTINIEEVKLNIKHGINGTGKSTISRSLKYKENEDLNELQSFYTDCKPEVSVVPDLLLTICDRLNCEIGDIVEIVERRNGKA